MGQTAKSGNAKYHAMMVFMVIVWGLELSVAKDALNYAGTFFILNCKYFLGCLLIAVVCAKKEGIHLPRMKDLPLLIASTLVGHIIYFYCEYGALATVPVANITIVLAFLPIASIIIEKIIFKRKTTAKLFLFMICLVIGIFFVIGSDFTSLRGGSATGYLFCAGALAAWLAFLFLTEAVTNLYGAIQTAFYQTFIAWILTLPAMIPHVSALPDMPPLVLIEFVYLGLISEGVCFLIEITGLEKLGPTVSAVYNNFLPVTSAFFGFVLLHQNLVLLQCFGGLVVIIFGYLVIREKDRVDRLS